MAIPAKWSIVGRKAADGLTFLIIKDDYDGTSRSVTNAAEDVVKELFDSGELKSVDHLLCYDTDGQLDELLFVNDQFVGFAFFGEDKARELEII